MPLTYEEWKKVPVGTELVYSKKGLEGISHTLAGVFIDRIVVFHSNIGDTLPWHISSFKPKRTILFKETM